MEKLMGKMHATLRKYASGKNVLALFILTQVVYGIMLVHSIPEVMQYSVGMKILDMMPTGYGSKYVQGLFQTLGEAGRDAYLHRQIPIDMVYPGLFAISYALLLVYIFRKAFSEKSWLNTLWTLPFLAGMFDYFENIGIITMLNIHPVFQTWLVQTTSAFTVLKSIFTTFTFISIFSGIAVILVRRFTSSTKSQELG